MVTAEKPRAEVNPKKPDTYLREYCQKLSDDSVKFLIGRLNQRLNGDVAEAVNFLGNCKEIDRWFVTATTSDEFYDMLDVAHGCVGKEHEIRSNRGR